MCGSAGIPTAAFLSPEQGGWQKKEEVLLAAQEASDLWIVEFDLST
jgi:hypothetical protein